MPAPTSWRQRGEHLAGGPIDHDHEATLHQQDPLVDADALLALTSELRSLRARLDDADVTDEQRQRWQRTLGAIAEGGTSDIEKARAQLRRLAARVDRAVDAG